MKKLDIVLRKGATWQLPVMWESDRLAYKTITQVTPTSPVRITAVGHGIPDGWRVAVANVKGPSALNAAMNPPRDHEFRVATVVSPDAIEFNKVNAAGWPAYVTGGQLVYYEPMPLLDAQARMQIKNKVNGIVLHELTTADGGITIDLIKSRLVLTITAEACAAFTWRRGVYDLEVFDASGVVTPLLYGSVNLTSEVTTTA